MNNVNAHLQAIYKGKIKSIQKGHYCSGIVYRYNSRKACFNLELPNITIDPVNVDKSILIIDNKCVKLTNYNKQVGTIISCLLIIPTSSTRDSSRDAYGGNFLDILNDDIIKLKPNSISFDKSILYNKSDNKYVSATLGGLCLFYYYINMDFPNTGTANSITKSYIKLSEGYRITNVLQYQFDWKILEFY